MRSAARSRQIIGQIGIAHELDASPRDVIGLRMITSSPSNAGITELGRSSSSVIFKARGEKQHISERNKHLPGACGGVTNINSRKAQRRPVPGTAHFVERNLPVNVLIVRLLRIRKIQHS